MRRLLAIVLLALLPLQFSWAAVASYCGHETQGDVVQWGHHDHQHQHPADASADASADVSADAGRDAHPDPTSNAVDGKAPGAMDLDCGHCHGTCGMMLTLPSGLQLAHSTAPLSATLDQASGAHAPTRPERPQWLPLA